MIVLHDMMLMLHKHHLLCHCQFEKSVQFLKYHPSAQAAMATLMELAMAI
jgi:hypothetical protein